MPSWIVPSDSHAVSDTGHTTDHNHIVDDLSLIATAFPGVTTGIPSINQTLAINKITTPTTTYSIQSTDFAVLCNATSGAFAVTLPSAATNPGQLVLIKKTDSTGNVVTIDTTGGQTIDGFSSGGYVLINKNWAAMLLSDGSNWHNITSFEFTDNNILDDGSGNMTVANEITVNGGIAIDNASVPALMNLIGTSNGTSYSEFNLCDNSGPDVAGHHYWSFSHRTTGHEFLIYNYNGSVYTDLLALQENGAFTTVANNTLDDSSGNVTIVGNTKLAAGTATLAPLTFQSGTNLTTATAGATEYDGVARYYTNETTSGRGLVPVEQRFRLTATGSNITTIANFFGTTSNIPLVASGEYEIEIDCWFLKTTAGTVTWTFTNSSAPTSMTIDYQLSPATGIVSTAAATDLFGQQYNVTSTAPTVVSGSLTSAVNHRHKFWIRLINGSGTSLKIQATASAGTITPGINSFWRSRRVPAANVGTFAA